MSNNKKNDNKAKMTIYIAEDLFIDLKIYCAKNKSNLTKATVRAIKEFLEQEKRS